MMKRCWGYDNSQYMQRLTCEIMRRLTFLVLLYQWFSRQEGATQLCIVKHKKFYR